MKTFLICFTVGIIAQMIDGTLGMAYGVTCSTFLRTFGIPSALSSACVHLAEVFTTLVSGISHLSMKNTNLRLVAKLAVPGVIGGVIGAYVLTSLDDSIISPIISAYLIIMGFVIFFKMFKKQPAETRKIGKAVYPLAFVGGLSDCIGGGGWGPIVTSTLVAANHDVKETIGSVNTAEFFVTVAESVMFFLTLGSIGEYIPAVGGLIIGGVIAAPVAAYLCKKVPVRALLGVVGVLIIGVNTWKLIAALV